MNSFSNNYEASRWILWIMVFFKVEYHADAEYQNPLKNCEKIACVGQRLLYPIMGKNNTLPH